MDKRKVILKEGKEKSLLQCHPWIFSGAIAHLPEMSPGEVLPVYSSSHTFLALAYFHPGLSLTGRVLSFTDLPIDQILEQAIDRALSFRKSLFHPLQTNCYRLIHAEADGLPGLIVDDYDGVLVLQSSTYGIDRLKSQIVEILIRKCQPKAIYEKSLSSSREVEGLTSSQGFLYGKAPDLFTVMENGIPFYVSVTQGQKTGFFLDQREMRQKVRCLSSHRRVLNCFSYSGGFSLYALDGGAQAVTSIDCSEEASLLASKNDALSRTPSWGTHTILQEDVFSFLRRDPLDYDLIILDPPAFAKKRHDVDGACRGYKEINRLCFQKMRPGTLLLTCSCSYFIDTALFQNLLFQAALEAKRHVKILSGHILSPDHPISLYHPEGSYLKSFLLYIA